MGQQKAILAAIFGFCAAFFTDMATHNGDVNWATIVSGLGSAIGLHQGVFWTRNAGTTTATTTRPMPSK